MPVYGIQEVGKQIRKAVRLSSPDRDVEEKKDVKRLWKEPVETNGGYGEFLSKVYEACTSIPR